MSNIMDYLDWRGDIPVTAAPFCEVDNYILAKLVTPDFTGIVPPDGESIPIGEAVERFFDGKENAEYLGALSSPYIVPMVRRLPETERFGHLLLSRFARRVVPERAEQFSAMTIRLPGGAHYIAYRGTDDTIAAWKENFLMAVEDAVPAQRDALAYLLLAAQSCPGTLTLGGHSKGGNLAVYAAAFAPEEIQARIDVIYNNDGPGFRENVLETPGYRRIRDRIVTILPQYAMVGTLLTQDTVCNVVKSSRFGMDAHDGFNWEVLGPRFVRCPGLSRSSRAFDEGMEECLAGMDMDERRAFINGLFDTLTSTGAVTLTELTEHKLRQAVELARNLRPGVYKNVAEMLEQIIREYVSFARQEVSLPRRFRRKSAQS